MPTYRIFSTDGDGHISAPSTVISCDTDEQAVATAEALHLGFRIEIWQSTRRIAVLTSPELPVSPLSSDAFPEAS